MKRYDIFLIGFVCGACLIFLMTVTTHTPDEKVIELGCASYNEITGEFKLKPKEQTK